MTISKKTIFFFLFCQFLVILHSSACAASTAKVKDIYSALATDTIRELKPKVIPMKRSKVMESKKRNKVKNTNPVADGRVSLPGLTCVVIDPGHGGKDYGAPGYEKGVHEKEITLSVAKRLRSDIERHLKCKALLTREEDTTLTLDERTKFANANQADLFVSIHANASLNDKAYGTETYILNHATDEAAVRVAARENNTTTEQVSDLQLILSSLMQNAKINESSQLASYVQESIFNHMKKEYSLIKDKGIKQAPFVVLLGARMPAILIEMGFISNEMECKRLTTAGYQDKLCKAITEGVLKYWEEAHPTALKRLPQKTGTNR